MTDYDDLLQRLAREDQAEVDADRLELRLWALVRGEQRVEARTRWHPRGIELVVTVDGELHTAQAFTAAQVPDLDNLEAALRRAFEREGWQDAGPRD